MKTWTGARFAHDRSLACPICDVPPSLGMHHVAAALPPPLRNPKGGDTWYHGTSFDPVSSIYDRDDDDDDPGGRVEAPDRYSDEYGANAEHHWNTDLGSHFTSLHGVARSFATGGGGTAHTDPSTESRVLHAGLHMANPKHFETERDMGKAAIEWAHSAGHHMLPRTEDPDLNKRIKNAFLDGPHRDYDDYGVPTEENEADRDHEADEHVEHLNYIHDHHRIGMASRVAMASIDEKGVQSHHSLGDTDNYLRMHPHREEITEGWREHLKSQGHDGITYGNSYEGPVGHTCAITFPDTVVHHRHWQWLHPDRAHLNAPDKHEVPQPGIGQPTLPSLEHWKFKGMVIPVDQFFTLARSEPWESHIHGDRHTWMQRTQDEHAAHLEAQRADAERATNGYMVSPEGKARGIRAEDFFKPGNRRSIEQWGTPEMKAWHGSESAPQVGPRSTLGKMPTLTEYRHQVRLDERAAYDASDHEEFDDSGIDYSKFASVANGGHKESWEPGEQAHFEYHCLESHDSADAQAWYRSHQPVTVLHKEDSDTPEDMDAAERASEGMPHTYRVRWADGFEHSAWEDELHTDPKYFHRPDPPKKRQHTATKDEEIPAPMGSTEVPPGHVRLYHQSDESNTPSIKEQGLRADMGGKYGNPPGLWAGTKPWYGTEKPYLHTHEFHVPVEDLTDDAQDTRHVRDGRMSPEEWSKDKHTVLLRKNVPASSIIATHEPWHDRVRYMRENGLVDEVKSGGFDFLADEPEYGKAIEHIKKHGKSEPEGCYFYPNYPHEHTKSEDPDWGDECPYESQHTDWTHHYPRLGQTLHRGLSQELHPDAHDESKPMHERAMAALGSVAEANDGLGTHWTTNKRTANEYALRPNYDPDPQTAPDRQSPVIIHAETPPLEDIDTDPESLKDSQTFGYDKHDDEEVPIQRHADVSVKGISWLKNHRHPDRNNPDHWNHHDFTEWQGHTAALAEDDALPPEPGTAPVPEGHVRLWHYTHPDNVPSIKEHGLLESHAHGDGNRGAGNEPSAGVWASTRKPDHEFLGRAAHVEFHAPLDQISGRADDPWRVRAGMDSLEDWQAGYHHVIMNGDVKPSQILAVHEPWHTHLRDIGDDEQTKAEVKSGMHDSLLDDPDWGKAIEHVKKHGARGYVLPEWYNSHLSEPERQKEYLRETDGDPHEHYGETGDDPAWGQHGPHPGYSDEHAAKIISHAGPFYHASDTPNLTHIDWQHPDAKANSSTGSSGYRNFFTNSKSMARSYGRHLYTVEPHSWEDVEPDPNGGPYGFHDGHPTLAHAAQDAENGGTVAMQAYHPLRVTHAEDTGADNAQHTAAKIAGARSEQINALGRTEHPNVDEYRSGGIGHFGEDRSVVGFLPTRLVHRYREHNGDWHGDYSQQTVDGIREDIRSGKGITNPLMMEYDHDLGWGYLGEGNHRLRAAREEGLSTVPVRVVGRSHLERRKAEGIGDSMHLNTDFAEQAGQPYVPPDVHPHHFTYAARPEPKTAATHDGLDDEGRISVAEMIMETGGHSGKSWHVPRMHMDDPARAAAHQPVNDHVHAILTGEGWEPGGPGHRIRVHPHHWDLREPGSGMAQTDGLNYIGLKGEDTNDLTLLHECAHILHGTGEGQGHGPGFRDTVSRLYHKHLGPQAGAMFDRFSVPPGERKEAGLNGDLPEGITFHHGGPGELPADYPYRAVTDGEREIRARIGDQTVGQIRWLTHTNPNANVTPGHITFAGVHPDYHRQGIASEMLRQAREVDPSVHHATNTLTDDGSAWAQHTAAVLDTWAPSERLFAPTKGTVDPRLFDVVSKQMRPTVRAAIVVWVNEFFERHGYEIGGAWRRIYLAGSQASEWYGNNDFDVLVGIHYERFRRANPTQAALSDAEIGAVINTAFRADFNDEHWVPPFDREHEWHLTGYVNANSWDIAKIKPYAAYNVTDDVWAVEPIHEPTGHRFDTTEMYYFEGFAAAVRNALALREPTRRVRCTLLWKFVHADRSRAFGPHGTGAFDRGNALEKYLDQAPYTDGQSLMAALSQAKFGDQHTAGLNGDLPEGLEWGHRQVKGWLEPQHMIWANHPDVAHQKAALIRWSTEDHHIIGISVHHSLRRRGLGAELLRRAKEIDPEITHSVDRTDDGEAWAQHTGDPLPERKWDGVGNKITAASTAPHRSFYLPEHGGKYHRANPITGQAMCRGTILLDTDQMPFTVADDATKVHPMVCRKCLGKDHPANQVKKQGAKGDLPDGYTLDVQHEDASERWGLPKVMVKVLHGGHQVGGLGVHQRDVDGEVVGHPNVWVDPEHQRKGLATAMYAEVGRRWPDVPIQHSEHASDAARALNSTLAVVAARAHDVWGSNDIDRLFPGGAPTTTTPWPMIGRTKSRPVPYSKDLLGKALADPGKHMDEVDPRELHAYQSGITRGGVKYYLGDEYRQTGKTFADQDKTSNQVPVIYTRSDGKSICLSGHHRAAAALLKGEKLQCLHVREDSSDASHPVRDAEPVPGRTAGASVAHREGDHGQRGAGGHRQRWYRRAAAALLGGGGAGPDVAGSQPDDGHRPAQVRQDGLAVTAHQDAMGDQDWDQVIHDVPDHIHRGVGVHLPDDLHAFVHDDTKPTADRAKALLRHLHSPDARTSPYEEGQAAIWDHRSGVGTSWSGDRSIAESFASDRAHDFTEKGNSAAIRAKDHRWGTSEDGDPVGKPGTAVVVSIHKPERDDIDEDPNGDGGGMRYTYHGHGEREVPLLSGTQHRVHSVSWQRVPHWSHPTEYLDEPPETKHTFGEDDPMHVEAARRDPFNRFTPPDPPEGQHAIYRGLHIGPNYRLDTPPWTSGPMPKTEKTPLDFDDDQVVLDHLSRNRDYYQKRDFNWGPEHPKFDRVPMYGAHWTKDHHLARQFALDATHGRYRVPATPQGHTWGAVMEVHSATEPEHDATGSQFGESEVKWPGRQAITGVKLHLHHFDPDHPKGRTQDTYVRTIDVPEEHYKTALLKTAWYRSDHPDVEEGSDLAEFQPDTEAVKDELDRLRGGPRVKESELRQHWQNGTVPKHLYRAISETDFRRSKAQGYLDTKGEGNWMRPDKGEHAEGMVTATDPHHIARTYLPAEGGRVVKIETHPEHGWRRHAHDKIYQWQTATHDTKVPWEHVVDHSGPLERRFNPETWSIHDAVQMKGEGHAPADQYTTADNLEYFKRILPEPYHHLHPFHPDHGKITTTGGLYGPPWYATAPDAKIDEHPAADQIRSSMTEHVSPQGHHYRITHDGMTYASYLGKGERRVKTPQIVGALSLLRNWDGPGKHTIHKIQVLESHQRRGIATAMLQHTREQVTDGTVSHSTALTDDGKAFSQAVAAKTQRYFHATPHDLSGQTHLLPPSQTGREPNWDDMDPSEDHQVFMSHSLESAHGWGAEIGAGPYHVYEVEPEGEVETHGSTSAAPRARIIREAKKPQSIEVAGICVKAADTGRVLMLQRSFADESDPARGTWEFPGGHIDDGEDPFTAGRREWCEETGGKFPDSAPVVGNWISGGMYQGFVVVVEHEADLDVNLDHEDRVVLNPDDPDGDDIETVAWWDLKHLKDNPAVRKEVTKGTDWDLLKKAKMPVQKAASAEDDEWRMQHRPPGRDGIPMHDITSNLPDDVLTHPHYYSDMSEPSNQEAHHHIRRVQGRPEAKVHVYRSLPAEHVHQGIRPGDWVSLSRDYARQHGKHATDPKHDWPVIRATVAAGDLHTDADDFREFGYNGESVKNGMVSYKGGYHQEVSQRADGSIAPVQRRQASLAEAKDEWLGDGSMDIAGAAAHLTNAKNWMHHPNPRWEGHARDLMAAAKPVRHTLYHGVATSHSHQVGDRLDIPLKATSRDREVAEDAAPPDDFEPNPTIYEFEPGAHAVEIHPKEHVVTGRYEVTHAETGHVRLKYVEPLTVGEHKTAQRGLGWHHIVMSQRSTMYPVHAEVEAYVKQKTGVHPKDMVWSAEPYSVDDATPDPHGIRSRTRLDSAEQGYRTHPAQMPPVIAIEHDGKREHVDGWHRLGGAQRAGLSEVPAYVGRVRTTKTASTEQEWYHGSNSPVPVTHFERRNRQETDGGPRDWNTELGSHWTSDHQVAHDFTPSDGTLHHARLEMTNPKHYEHEYDLGNEAHKWARSTGEFDEIDRRPKGFPQFENRPYLDPDSEDEGPMPSLDLREHPRAREIADRFKAHLESQGHDGIIYGNAYEGEEGHPCAIPFHGHQIHLTGTHGPGKCPQGLPQREWDPETDDYKTASLMSFEDYHERYERAGSGSGEGRQERRGLDQPGGSHRGAAPSRLARGAGAADLDPGASGVRRGLSGWTRLHLPLTDLVTEHETMEGVLHDYDHGLHSETPDEPLLVRARDDMPGKYEIADGHHRVADAIRKGRTHLDVDVDHVPDDEPYQEPFYDFSQHMGHRTAAILDRPDVTSHRAVEKDLRGLDKPALKQVMNAVDGLVNADPLVLAQTHPLKGSMKGWYSTKASRGHRIVHQPNDAGGVHVGYVGLHEYGDAERRLASYDPEVKTTDKTMGVFHVSYEGARDGIKENGIRPGHDGKIHVFQDLETARHMRGGYGPDVWHTYVPAGTQYHQGPLSGGHLVLHTDSLPKRGLALVQDWMSQAPKKEAGLGLPEGFEVHYTPAELTPHTSTSHQVIGTVPSEVHPDQRIEVGALHLDSGEDWSRAHGSRQDQGPYDGPRRVSAISVHPLYRRRGVATALWEHAKSLGLNPAHDDDGLQFPDGQAWAEKTAAAQGEPNLWPKHPVFRPGDRVMETTPNGKQYPGTVHHQEESTDAEHHGTVWVENEDRYGRGPVGLHPSRLAPHPDAPPEQHEYHRQQTALNDAGTPYVPEAERNIDESDRVTVHHLTDQPHFTPDTSVRPENNTTMGGSLSPRLFVGHPSTWAEGEHHYRRPYVAEMTVPRGAVQYKGGYQGEGEIPGRHFDKVHVNRVLPYDEHRREQDEPGYHSEVDTRTWSPAQHREHLRQHRETLHTEHGWGWNEFDRNHNHVGLGDDDWDEDMVDPNSGYRGTYVRRDKKGKPMTQVRSSLR